MKETNSRYFIVSARCYEVKAFNGSVLTHEDEEAWLGSSDGYAQWYRSKNNADHFTSVSEARSTALKNDGMPWYVRLKPDSLRVFEINKKMITEITETEKELH